MNEEFFKQENQTVEVYQEFKQTEAVFESKKLVSHLKDLFFKIFIQQPVYQKDFPNQLHILKLIDMIISKKFFKTCNKLNSQVTQKELMQKVLESQKIDSSKRPEENNKFVYKGVMKLLKNKFYKERHLKNSKESEELFYHHYFQWTAAQQKIDVKEYFDPLNLAEKKHTLNGDYLTRVFSVD